jgi:hypothetical protein
MTPITYITFPEISLQTRDAHKLRGYFGRLFQARSPLLHNHWDDGRVRYAYPLVQYKVLRGLPTLCGLGEGAHLLVELFMQVQELNLEGVVYPLYAKNIETRQVALGLMPEPGGYRFESLWLPLNQENYHRYQGLDAAGRQAQLAAIACRNIQALYKACGYYLGPEERITTEVLVTPTMTRFKNQPMLAFNGTLRTNARLPDRIGLGKSVSRGFGAVVAVGGR